MAILDNVDLLEKLLTQTISADHRMFSFTGTGEIDVVTTKTLTDFVGSELDIQSLDFSAELSELYDVRLPALEDDLNELNNTKLPQLDDEISDLNNVELPALNADLADLNNNKLPALNADLADLNDNKLPALNT
jgi:hypothetical protein